MKKYLIASITFLALTSCDIQPGGNKNIVKRAETQPRYNDNLHPSETEPNFAPDQSKKPAITDSVRMAGGAAAVSQPTSEAAQNIMAPEATAQNASATAEKTAEEATKE